MKSTKAQLQKAVRHLNEEYIRDGSEFRAYLTGDKFEPIGVIDLSKCSFPEAIKEIQELRLLKFTKPL